MSFSNIPYYKPFIQQLNEKYDAGSGVLTEEELRNLFSRAYYTILLHCRDTLDITTTLYSSHDTIIKSIPNVYTKRALQNLKKSRKQADYDEEDFLSNHSKIMSLFTQVDQILSFSKDQLKSKR